MVSGSAGQGTEGGAGGAGGMAGAANNSRVVCGFMPVLKGFATSQIPLSVSRPMHAWEMAAGVCKNGVLALCVAVAAPALAAMAPVGKQVVTGFQFACISAVNVDCSAKPSQTEEVSSFRAAHASIMDAPPARVRNIVSTVS